MRRIAQQRHAPLGPPRQRVAVAHRIFEDLGGRLDQLADIDEGQMQPLGEMTEGVVTPKPGPILPSGRRRAGFGDPGVDDPVGQAGVFAVPRGRSGRAPVWPRRRRRSPCCRRRRRPASPPRRATSGCRSSGCRDHRDADLARRVEWMPSAPINASPVRTSRRPGGVLESGFHMVCVLDVAGQPLTGAHSRRPETLGRRLPQHRVQPAAVDGELRHIVPGVQPAWLRPDRLARDGWHRSVAAS